MPSNCSADTHAAVTYADNILATGTAEEVSLLKKAVWLTQAANPRNESFGAPYPSDPEALSYWQIGDILGYAYQSSFSTSNPTGISIL